MKKTFFVSAIALFFLVLFFQNCANQKTIFTADSSKEAPPLASRNGNGQPYEGKPYVLLSGGICADGTQVQGRIIMKSATTAQLVRQNCQTIPPKDLSGADFFVNASDQLTYLTQVFVPETPVINLKLMTTWYYQLQKVLQTQMAKVYDIDMFDNTSAAIGNLKSAGHVVICYISAGSYEAGRPDAGSFKSADIGNILGGGSPDLWLDTRSMNVRSIMISRLDLAKSKGCDGVDFDNVDAYYSNSGFVLNASTQIDYNLFLARAAHDRGLLVALNNVGDLAPALVNDFDFVVAEQCYAAGECDKFRAFTERGKPVFDAEYTSFSAVQCSAATAASISLGFYNKQLDGGSFIGCP